MKSRVVEKPLEDGRVSAMLAVVGAGRLYAARRGMKVKIIRTASLPGFDCPPDAVLENGTDGGQGKAVGQVGNRRLCCRIARSTSRFERRRGQSRPRDFILWRKSVLGGRDIKRRYRVLPPVSRDRLQSARPVARSVVNLNLCFFRRNGCRRRSGRNGRSNRRPRSRQRR